MHNSSWTFEKRNKKGSKLHEQSKIHSASGGWYDVYHQWRKFFLFTKNTWIRDSGTLCHTTNNDKGLYDVTNIYKLVQGSSGRMATTEKGKLHMKVCQVNGSKQLHMLWPVNYCAKVSASLSLLLCKLLQDNKIQSDQKYNIVILSSIGNIILNCWIKTQNSWVKKTVEKQAPRGLK